MDRNRHVRTATWFECLGEVTVAARPALVLWPGAGDAIAIDFVDNGSRFAAAYRLDGTPRLDPQPRYDDLLGRNQLDALLALVVEIWSACSGRSS